MTERKKRRRRFGAVRQLPSGRWQARYRSPDGRLITAPKTFATKTDADRYLAKVETDQLGGGWTDSRLGRITFAEWAERWEAGTVDLRANTRASYRVILRRYLKPAFDRYPLVAIDPLAVRAWLAQMESDGIGASTRAKAYRLLSRILALAVESRYIATNPCTVRRAASDQSPEMRIATIEQITAIAGQVPPRFKALVLVAAYGGLRWGELAGLRRKRIDLDTRVVVVAEQLLEVNGTFGFGPAKSRAGHRTVTLPAAVAVALDEHLRRYVPNRPDAIVFVGERGALLRRSNFNRRIWAPATRATGATDLRFHDLRHTAGTLATAAGASLREVMSRLGHSTTAAAIRYQHVLADRDAAIAHGLDRLINGGSGTDVAREREQDPPGTQEAGSQDPA
jgi:integrase